MFGLICNCVLYCNWESFKISVALVDAAADFMVSTKRLVFVSAFYFAVSLIFGMVWISFCIRIYSTSQINASVNGKRTIVTSTPIWVMLGFMCFSAIWLLIFISSKTSFIYMYAASSYYFSSSKDSEGTGKVMQGVQFAYFKHAGSLAFGSLVNAIVKIIRILVDIL
jgi:hypothetical protein